LILLSISEKGEPQFAENYGFSNNQKKNAPKKMSVTKKRNQLQERERERKQANLGFIANLAFVFPPLPRPWRRMEVFVVH
jgi:hypothetical protein